VKTWIKIIAFGFAFLLGVAIGVGAYHLCVLNRAMADAKTRWLICGAHQHALYERADQYHTQFGRWPTNVQELVEARLLPEFSEVHLCPSEVGRLARSEYQDSVWVGENQSGVVASHFSSPYRFQVASGKLAVICGFETEHKR